MADPNKRTGLRGIVKRRGAQLGNIMSQIRAGRGQSAKKKAVVPKKAGGWAGKKRSAYSD